MPNILPVIYFIRAGEERRVCARLAKDVEKRRWVGGKKKYAAAPLSNRCVLFVIKRPQICFGNRLNKFSVVQFGRHRLGGDVVSSNRFGFEIFFIENIVTYFTFEVQFLRETIYINVYILCV